MKLPGEARKRSKNEPPNSARHGDGELISEMEVVSLNKDLEAARAKTESFKIDFVNVAIEASNFFKDVK